MLYYKSRRRKRGETPLLELLATFFTTPPGSLIIQIVLLLAYESALAISYSQWKRKKEASINRVILGSLLLGLTQLLALLTEWLILSTGRGLAAIPPLNRTIGMMSLSLMGWTFLTMDVARKRGKTFVHDTLLVALLALYLIGLAGSFYYWNASDPGAGFNGSFIGRVWTIAKLLISGGYIITFIALGRKTRDGLLKSAVMFLFMLVSALDFLLPPPGDVSISTTLIALVNAILFVAIAYRHVIEKLLRWDTYIPSAHITPIHGAAPVIEETEPISEVTESRETDVPLSLSSEPSKHQYPDLYETVEAVTLMLESLDATEAIRAIPQQIAQALHADIALLGIVDERAEQISVVSCYDNIAQVFIKETVINLNQQETMREAIYGNNQLSLARGRNDKELFDLFTRLGITNIGPAYIQPLAQKGSLLGVLLVGLPYSERQFSEGERNLLSRFGPLISNLMLAIEQYEKQRETSEKALAQESTRLVEVADELAARQAELKDARRQVEEMKAYVRDAYNRAELTDRLRQENERLAEELAQYQQKKAVGLVPKAFAEDDGIPFTSLLRTEGLPASSLIPPLAADQALPFTEYHDKLDDIQSILNSVKDVLQKNQHSLDGLSALKEVIGLHADEIADLKNQLITLSPLTETADSSAVEALQGQLTQHENLIVELKSQLSAKTTQAAELTNRIAALEREVEELTTTLSERENYISELEEKLASLDTETLNQAATLKALLEEKDQSITQISKELSEAGKRIAELEAITVTTREEVLPDGKPSSFDQEIQDTIASLAQELRSPMFSIIGYTDVLLSEKVGILGELQQKFLMRVKSNTERMEYLLDDLIQVITIDQGKSQLSEDQVNILYLIEALLEDFSAQLIEKQITVYLDLDKHPPLLIADTDAVNQILSHLLTNAMMASPADGSIRISLEAMRQPEAEKTDDPIAVHITFTDSGPGVDKNDYDRVFLRKYRADNPLIEGLGDTGVGLALTKTLVETMNGRVWIESEKNKGTQFHVMLPVDAQQGLPT